MSESIIYALDFDGVICDSAIETGISGWKAAHRLWPEMSPTPPDAMVEQFRAVRPIIETGYEAILTMRLLSLGHGVAAITGQHRQLFPQLMSQAGVGIDELKTLFGATRDGWIAADRADWVAKNPLYPGVAEKLRRLNQQNTWYVVTTKQERFVGEILQANGIELDATRIFGLERKQPKPDILCHLLKQQPKSIFHFVEDRLPALISVRQYPELANVRLSFAEWGYNLAEDRQQAEQLGFRVLSLADFLN